MTVIVEPQPDNGLAEELLWVHSLIRRDLATVRTLSQQVRDGISPPDVQAMIKKLETQSPLWQLRVNCLYYCRFVHHHHTLEDRALFPALRQSNPALNPVVDKLEADHRKVSDILDEIQEAANALVAADTSAARQRVVEILDLLSDVLLEHLEYEEEQITPTLRTWQHWPVH